MTARSRAWMKNRKKRNALGACWRGVVVILGLSFPMIYRAAPSVAADLVVGVVREVRLDVFGTPPLRRKIAMVPDDQVYRGEILETGARAFLRVLLKDETHLTLGANSALVVDDLVFDPVREDGRLTLNLFEGAFHYVSGKLPKKAIRIETSSATIGIRGTELIIRVAHNGATTVGVIHGRAFIRSRESGAVQELKTGTSSTVSTRGFVGRPLVGVELTGDEGVDSYVPGIDHWREEQKQPLNGLEGSQEAVHDEGVRGEGDGAGGPEALDARREDARGESLGAESQIERAGLQEGDRASSEQGMGGGDVSGGEGDQGGGDRSPERASAQSRESAHDTGSGSDATSSSDHGEND